MINRSSHGENHRSSFGELRLSSALEDFRLYHKAKGSDPKTIYILTFAVNRLMNLIGDPLVEEITTAMLRSAMVQVQETRRSDGALLKVQTVHTVYVKWRTFFNWMVDEGYLEKSPMKRLSPPRLDNKLLPALDEKELKRLDGVLRGSDLVSLRNRALVFLFLDSAVRLEECYELRVSDIDLETGTVRVRNGKGRKERITRIGSTTLRALTRYLRAAKLRGDDPLWISHKGDRLTRWGIRDALTYIGKCADIHLHAHKLRRTCALQMLRNGADIYSIQHLMGHSDLDVLKKYLAQHESDIARVHERCGVIDTLKRRG